MTSPPRQIGICVNYTWDEAAYLACNVADLALRWGLPVSLFCTTHPETRVHYRWDCNVLSGKQYPFTAWASGCSHLVWFDVQPAKLSEARDRGIRNILVAMWQRLTSQDLTYFPFFDAVVSPTKACHNWLLEKRALAGATYAAPWDTGMTPVEDSLFFDGKKLLVCLDGPNCENAGILLFPALRMLLESDSQVHCTLLHSRSWSPQSYTALTDLRKRCEKQVQVIKRPSFNERLIAYAGHDWVFYPGLKPNSGLVALESLIYGKPVIAYDVPPMEELIVREETGLLIPCKIGYNGEHVPCAEPGTHDLLEQLQRATRDTSIREKLQDGAWRRRLKRRRDHFEKTWKLLWGYT